MILLLCWLLHVIVKYIKAQILWAHMAHPEVELRTEAWGRLDHQHRRHERWRGRGGRSWEREQRRGRRDPVRRGVARVLPSLYTWRQAWGCWAAVSRGGQFPPISWKMMQLTDCRVVSSPTCTSPTMDEQRWGPVLAQLGSCTSAEGPPVLRPPELG